MNPATLREAKSVFNGVKKTGSKMLNVQTVICPSFIHLRLLKDFVSGHRVVLGAQNMHWQESGAHTGEISANQLIDSGAKYVILGHSERREQGETNDYINKKIHTAIKKS